MKTLRALWLEFREAGQYVKTWDDVEECLALVLLRQGLPLPVQFLGEIGPELSPRECLEQFEVPDWFRYDHVGVGSDVNYYATQMTLERTNANRREQYQDLLQYLAQAREVLSRTVRA